VKPVRPVHSITKRTGASDANYHHHGSEFDSGYGQRSQQRGIRELGLNAFRIQLLAREVVLTHSFGGEIVLLGPSVPQR
jgi:hypothetical protein